VGQVEFKIGSREYKMIISDQVYKIKVNLTWGGTRLSLLTEEGVEVATMVRKSFSPMKHKIMIPSQGELTSQQPLLDFYVPIIYSLKGHPLVFTRSVSPIRRVGRVGFFSNELPLPIMLFILSMTS
jgi:hypothetical protein